MIMPPATAVEVLDILEDDVITSAEVTGILASVGEGIINSAMLALVMVGMLGMMTKVIEGK